MTEVAVYCDASRRLPLLGAWGCVIVRPGAPPFEASGPFKSELRSSTLGEVQAAANAVHAAVKAGLVEPGDHVVIRCDNMAAVQWLNGEPFKRRKSNNRKDFRAIIDAAGLIAARGGFTFSALWVKGHQPKASGDPHAIHNRRADQLCSLITGTAKVRKSRTRPPKAIRLKLAAERAAAGAIEHVAAERKHRLVEIAKAGELRT